MAINPLYIPLFNIEEVILDKDSGLPLAAGVVRFYRDSQRLTPKQVYQITGTSPNYSFISLGAVLTLGLAGEFVDQDGDPVVPYAYPYDVDGNLDLYYVTVESSGGVPQFVRQAVPYVDTSAIPPSERASTSNELANPQFVEVNFPAGTTTLTVTGSGTVTKVAPDWDIISSGSGTIELERLEPTSAGVPTNPPYALRINASSGLGASVTLRQRLTNTPSIFRGGFASGSLTAAVISGGSSFITMTYAPSTGTSTEVITSTSIPTDGAYHIIAANAEIPDQANPAASTGYIDINITIPTSRNIAITSLQIVGTAFSINLPFDEETAARQKDHLFHYYENAVVRQPKESILAGWNFPLNPWHYFPTTSTNVTDNKYTADQTIIIQQNYVDTNVGNNVAVGRSSVATGYNFEVTAVTATNKFMALQYIDPALMRPYWGRIMSSMVRASIVTTHGTTAKFKVRLMYKAGLPAIISRTVPVSSWANTDDSIPTVSGDGWTYITPINDPTYTLTADLQNFSFDGFVLPAASSSSQTLGIAFIMMNNMNQTATADKIFIQNISLVRNDFAIETDAETYDQALRKCQYYFEYSWDQESAVGLVTSIGAITTQVAAISGAAPGLQSWFKSTKRANAIIVWYSPLDGAQPRILNNTAGTNLTVSSTTSNSTVITGFPNLTSNIPDGNTVSAHWTADSRLGVF